MAEVPANAERGNVVVFENGETNEAVLEGVKVTGGKATASSPYLLSATCGGGVYCGNSSPTLTNCIISGNVALHGGGGIACWGGAATLSNCTISENAAKYDGDGLGSVAGYGGGVDCATDSILTLINCRITGNSAYQDGGGISCRHSALVNATACIITGNYAARGGGVWCAGLPFVPKTTLVNSIIAGNSSDGVRVSSSGDLTLTNCVVWGNEAFGCSVGEATATFVNCIVWANGHGESIFTRSWIPPDVRYSIIESTSVWPGTGNTNADPRILSAGVFEFGRFTTREITGRVFEFPDFIVASGDYHLRPDSPAIDAGLGVVAPIVDLEGNRRPCGRRVDIGAYEFCTPPPPGTSVSLVSAPIADCAPAHVFVLLTNEQPVQAFSLGVAHDPSVAKLTAIDFADCPVIQALNGGQGPDFFGVDLAPGTSNCAPEVAGGGTVYCIASQTQPSTMTIPPGSDQPITRLTYEALPGHAVGTETPLSIVACLGGELPREVVITIDGLSYTPNLGDGTLTVAPSACRFIRGDANGDNRVDISDVVILLMSIFESGHDLLRCEDAGDANDDGVLDIADPIRILGRLFADGPPFPPPYPGCGTDPTPDALRCSENLCE